MVTSLAGEPGHEGGDDLVQRGVGLGAQVAVSGDLVQKSGLGALDVGQELLLKLGDLGGVDFVEESPDAAVDDGDLVLDGHGHVLALLQQLGQPHASVQQLLGRGVKIGSELGESSDLK